MGRINRPFEDARKKVIFECLDKYPDTSTRQIAKILMRDHGEFFYTYEDARGRIRYWRGVIGERNRKSVSTKKYFKNEIQLA